MKSVTELQRHLKRELKETKANFNSSKTSADRNYFEGKEVALREVLIKFNMLKETLEIGEALIKERRKKTFLLGLILGTLFGGTILTTLTYIIIQLI